jgi:hypothetical protein
MHGRVSVGWPGARFPRATPFPNGPWFLRNTAPGKAVGLTDKLIRRGVHTSVQALENDIKEWIATWNENPRPFTWPKTTNEILNSLADYLAKVGACHPAKGQE